MILFKFYINKLKKNFENIKLSAKYLEKSFDKWAKDGHHIGTKNEIIKKENKKIVIRFIR